MTKTVTFRKQQFEISKKKKKEKNKFKKETKT